MLGSYLVVGSAIAWHRAAPAPSSPWASRARARARSRTRNLEPGISSPSGSVWGRSASAGLEGPEWRRWWGGDRVCGAWTCLFGTFSPWRRSSSGASRGRRARYSRRCGFRG